ncbi:MAG: hypothetical protein EOO41_01165 [Methanobacteriota archaeon]|nr:MAG: hypothetical protein EOO41_01165 [Euryarchaeota archaeon]
MSGTPQRQTQAALMQRIGGGGGLSVDEVSAFVEDAIMTGQPLLAMELIEAAAGVEAAGQPALVTPQVLQRLLSVATYGQNVEVGDRVVSLALQQPATRIDVRVVELYAALVGDLPQPDYVRGLAFCNLMLELGFNAFAPYLASLNRAHGDAGLAGVVHFIASEALSFEALRCILNAFFNLGSPRIAGIVPLALDAAEREASDVAAAELGMLPHVAPRAPASMGETTEGEAEPLSSGHAPRASTSVLGAASLPGARAEGVAAPEVASATAAVRTRLMEEVYAVYINSLITNRRPLTAFRVMARAMQDQSLQLTYPAYLIGKKIVSILSYIPPPLIARDDAADGAALATARELRVDEAWDEADASIDVQHNVPRFLLALSSILDTLLQQEALRPRFLGNVCLLNCACTRTCTCA